MDKADVYWGISYPSYGVWHCLLHQFYSHLLPCFKSHSFWDNGKLLESYFETGKMQMFGYEACCLSEVTLTKKRFGICSQSLLSPGKLGEEDFFLHSVSQ